METEIDLLHRMCHIGPSYEKSIETEDILINLALSAGEIVLAQLGMCLILTVYPCLSQEVMAFMERTEEIVNAQMPDEDPLGGEE